MAYMNTVKTWQYESKSSGDTEQLAAKIGARLTGGEVIELRSDLGGGKTVFVRGLARGMGSSDTVASPSFTISRQYQATKLKLHHYDFYRLSEPGIMARELAEVMTDPLAVIVVEWSDIVMSVLPPDRLSVTIIPTSGNGRQLQFTAGPRHQHLLLTEGA